MAHAQQPNVARINYLELFLTARSLVRHMLVLEPHGIASLLHLESCPRDMHEVVGGHLPDEVYHLVAQGVVMPQQLNNLLSGVLLEAPPLVDSKEYRELLDQLVELRAAALGILSNELNDYYQQRRVVTARWYAPETDVAINHAAHRATVGGWHPRARGSLLEQHSPLSLCVVARLLSSAKPGEVPALLTAPPV